MIEYPSISTLYRRDKNGKVTPGDYSRREFALPKRWLITEKIDGMNVRVSLNQGNPDNLDPTPTVWYSTRQNTGQVSGNLLDYLKRTFPLEKVRTAFDPGTEAILFGEAYGPGIRKGRRYRSDISFRLFDVVVYGYEPGRDSGPATFPWWLNWESVDDIAHKFNIVTVPVLHYGATILEALEYVRMTSNVAAVEGGPLEVQEGIVARTDPLLFDRRGERVMWKLKQQDF